MGHLVQFTAEHREQAVVLQTALTNFEAELQKALEEIWMKPTDVADDGSGPSEDSWAKRMEAYQQERAIPPIDKVPKPVLVANSQWKIKLLDM